jgi:hypothetical protein
VIRSRRLGGSGTGNSADTTRRLSAPCCERLDAYISEHLFLKIANPTAFPAYRFVYFGNPTTHVCAVTALIAKKTPRKSAAPLHTRG